MQAFDFSNDQGRAGNYQRALGPSAHRESGPWYSRWPDHAEDGEWLMICSGPGIQLVGLVQAVSRHVRSAFM